MRGIALRTGGIRVADIIATAETGPIDMLVEGSAAPSALVDDGWLGTSRCRSRACLAMVCWSGGVSARAAATDISGGVESHFGRCDQLFRPLPCHFWVAQPHFASTGRHFLRGGRTQRRDKRIKEVATMRRHRDRRAIGGAVPPPLTRAIANALRDAAPADIAPIDWVVDKAGINHSDAAAMLAGTLDPSIDVADAVLRVCTGASLVAVARTLSLSPDEEA